MKRLLLLLPLLLLPMLVQGAANTNIINASYDRSNGRFLLPTNASFGSLSVTGGVRIGSLAVSNNAVFLDPNRNVVIQGATGEPGNNASDNSAFGSRSLEYNLGGYRNSGFGALTLSTNGSGFYNSAFGHGALRFNLSGAHNSAGGGDSLHLNTTGSGNSSWGVDSLLNNVSGSLNCAFGQGALIFNISGGDNCALGNGALFNTATNSANLGVGVNAGLGLTNGDYNTFIGPYSGPVATQKGNVSRSIAIGENAATTRNFQAVLGSDNIVETLLRGNVAIGVTNSLNRLVVGNPGIASTGVEFRNSASNQGPGEHYSAARILSSWVGTDYDTARLDLQTATGENAWMTGITVKTGKLGVATNAPAAALHVHGDVFVSGDVSALTFTDRSKSPDSLTNAYSIVSSIETISGHVNHSKLHPLAWGTKELRTPTGRTLTNIVDGVKGKITNLVAEATTAIIPDQTKRDIGMVISAQGMVIQDLIKRLAALERLNAEVLETK